MSKALLERYDDRIAGVSLWRTGFASGMLGDSPNSPETVSPEAQQPSFDWTMSSADSSPEAAIWRNCSNANGPNRWPFLT